jgi:quercetin dioxygenase-like cupin family protein
MRMDIDDTAMESEELTELAALAALDCLDPRDLISVRNLLEPEINKFSQIVHQLPYGIESKPPRTYLKERLFNQIKLEQSKTAQTSEFISHNSTEVTWHPHFVKGLKVAILRTDKEKRELSCLIRCEPGSKYPLHRHAGSEEIFMLEGDLIIDGMVYGKGDYLFSPPESAHAPETKEGCMFFARTSIDDEYFSLFNRIAANLAKSVIGF